MSGRSRTTLWKIWLITAFLVPALTMMADARAPVPLPTPQGEGATGPQEPLQMGADRLIHVKTQSQTFDLQVQAGADPTVTLDDAGFVRLLDTLSASWRPQGDGKTATVCTPFHYFRWSFGASEGTVDGRTVSWPQAMTMNDGKVQISLRALAQFLSFRLMPTPTAGTYTLVPLVEKIELRRESGDRKLVIVATAPVEASASTHDGHLRLVVPGARWGFVPHALQLEDVTVSCDGTGSNDDPVSIEVKVPAFWKSQVGSQLLGTEIPVHVLPAYVAQPGQPDRTLQSLTSVRSNGETFVFAELSGTTRHFWQYDPQSRRLVVEIPQARPASSQTPPVPTAEVTSIQTETRETSTMSVVRMHLNLGENCGFEVRMVPERDSVRLLVRVAPQAILPVTALQGGDTLIPDGVGRGIIVIDPGHGGSDPGACNRSLGLQEKNINLDICLRLKELLTRRGWTVRLTRDCDRDVSWAHSPDRVELGMRSWVAQEIKADLFISVHCNASTSSALNGTTYHWCKPEDLNLARSLLGALSQGTGIIDHGLVRNRFFVLRHTHVPAVLVETAFISNPTDATRLADQQIRQKIAENLAEALSLHMAREAAQRGQATTGR